MNNYKTKYEKYKIKYLSLKSALKSANGGSGGQQPNTVLTRISELPRELVPHIFQFMTIREIYNTCLTNTQVCIGISWEAVLRAKNIPHENVDVTPEDRLKFGQFCPILDNSEQPREHQSEQQSEQQRKQQRKQQDYCIIFFKHMEKLKRTDADIHTAVSAWDTNRAEAIESYGHIKDWDTSAVTNMERLFDGMRFFNEDLSSWDVSSVTTMDRMFHLAESFNSDLSSWNTSSVTDMHAMFFRATSFTSDLSSWNVNRVTDMRSMFSGAASFTSDLSSWNVRNVTDMTSMFEGATSFTSDLSSWNVRNGTKYVSITSMFDNTPAMLVKPVWYPVRYIK